MVERLDGMVAARTLKTSVIFEGIGLHSGRPVTMIVMPAPAGTGILFRRRDLLASSGPEGQMSGLERVTVAATPSAVCATTLGTVISNRHGVTVSTIEHIMAALAGFGVDNAIVELDGPEVPIMDGSAAPFVARLQEVGSRALGAPKTIFKLIKPVRVEKGDAFIEAVPNEAGALSSDISVTVDYEDPAIGRQVTRLDGFGHDFVTKHAQARTFCALHDVEAMREAGLALGGSLENAIVLSDGEVLNKEGLRVADEFVRHKALDLLGDLFLLGRPLAAKMTAFKPGHELNTKFAAAVLDQDAVIAAAFPETAQKAALMAANVHA